MHTTTAAAEWRLSHSSLTRPRRAGSLTAPTTWTLPRLHTPAVSHTSQPSPPCICYTAHMGRGSIGKATSLSLSQIGAAHRSSTATAPSDIVAAPLTTRRLRACSSSQPSTHPSIHPSSSHCTGCQRCNHRALPLCSTPLDSRIDWPARLSCLQRCSSACCCPAAAMGGSTSKPPAPVSPADESIANASRQLDLQLLDQQLADLFTFKILCLGAGESGKSTVVKQLKLIHKKPIESDELQLIATALHQNVIDCMKAVSYAAAAFQLPPLSSEHAATEQRLLSHDEHSRLTSELAGPILDLFHSPTYQAAYARRAEFWILDSFPYYLKHLHRFCEPDFVPTEEDSVMARVRTTGIVESELEQKIVVEEEDEPEQLLFRVVDVGGQRNERKKWMHCFSDVSAILFIVNLAGYNAVLFEDSNKNRLLEELELFEQITNNPLFKDTPIFLFLNKKDLFESSIADYPMSTNFPDYLGGSSLSAALDYIEGQFKKRLPDKKTVHIASVSARWKRDIKGAFEDVKAKLYDSNRKELLAAAGKINKQKKAITKQQTTAAAAAGNTAPTAAGKDAKTSDGGRKGAKQSGEGVLADMASCWKGMWDEDEDAAHTNKVYVGGRGNSSANESLG